jgi:putative transposase
LVIIGVNERRQKQSPAMEDGVIESTQSWREVLLKLKNRGINVPQLAISDGAMGLWSVIWMKYILILIISAAGYTRQLIFLTFSKKLTAKTKESIHQIWQAEIKINTEKAFELFVETYQDKYAKGYAFSSERS